VKIMAYNVLIVDDSSATRSAIKKVIKMSGFDVGEYFEAGNGREALAVLENNWADVILSDINMPIMDGLSFFKEILKDTVMASIPVIFVTTEGRGEGIKKTRQMGAKGYITKPFRPEEIRKVLVEVLGEPHGDRRDTSDLEGSDF
jgi:two-component system chemotaxis response regulator CheY